ncbi:sporulation protein YpjB [Neobacillus massiliamazoniensis]|uniref:Sporulation protein YpjB n=1 Tax=Neobacillus massiliamazoniensis TaxID=1499688 RepID=A0A0U1P0X8_9BACI|nr:sporulation protein YpjB [Neobacillus massiliamazoniensis]CRK83910.1 sporulation protein YpjB [Neobacillus massiliamazoniensis]
MNVKWILFFAIMLMLGPISVYAEQESPMEKLDNISDEALQMVKFHRYNDAKNLLDYFSNQFASISSKERPLSMDELRIVKQSRDEAVEATASTDMKYEERLNKVTKFRLVIDAIATTSHKPLWTEMEASIISALGQAKMAAEKGDSANFYSNYNQFLSLYNVVYPSLKIDVPVENIQKLDTRISFIDEYRTQIVNNPKSQQELNNLETDLKKIFESMNEDQADPSIWWVIISTGSIIIMTLSYVGWRKYKGEKEIKKDRSRDLKN